MIWGLMDGVTLVTLVILETLENLENKENKEIVFITRTIFQDGCSY